MSRLIPLLILLAANFPDVASSQSSPSQNIESFQDTAPVAAPRTIYSSEDSRGSGGVTLLRQAARPTARLSRDRSARTAESARSLFAPGSGAASGAASDADALAASEATLFSGPSSSATSVYEVLDPGAIAARMQQIEDASSLDEATKTALLAAYSETLESTSAASQFGQKIQQLQLERQQWPSAVELRAAIAAVAKPGESEVPPGTPLAEVEQLAAARDGQLAVWSKQLDELNQSKPERDRRAKELPALIQQTKAELAETAAELNRVATEESTLASQGAVTQLRARGKMLESKLQAMTLEHQNLIDSREVRTLRRELIEKQVRINTESAAVLQAQVTDLRREEAERVAQAARELLESSHPSLQAAARRNSELADLRTLTTARLEELTAHQQFVEK